VIAIFTDFLAFPFDVLANELFRATFAIVIKTAGVFYMRVDPVLFPEESKANIEFLDILSIKHRVHAAIAVSVTVLANGTIRRAHVFFRAIHSLSR